MVEQQRGDADLRARADRTPSVESEASLAQEDLPGTSSSGAPHAFLPSEEPIEAVPVPSEPAPEALPLALRWAHAKLSEPLELLKLHLKHLKWIPLNVEERSFAKPLQ